MILELFAAVALPLVVQDDVLEADGRELARPEGVELVVVVTDTRLHAVNPTDRAQMILLGSERDGPLAAAVLPPFGELDRSFPAGSLDGLLIEFASHHRQGIRRTGALPLWAMTAPDVKAVVFHTQGGEGHAWLSRARGLEWLPPGGAMLPATGSMSPGGENPTGQGGSSWATGPTGPPPQPPLHVPGPTPAGRRKGNVPPKVLRKPLSAV